jgi:uncharacterized membrane protein YtjA (UPF0391 family)
MSSVSGSPGRQRLVRSLAAIFFHGDRNALALGLLKDKRRYYKMLWYAWVFLVIAILAALFGFGGIAAGAASIAKIFFFVFVVLFVISLIAGRRTVV